EKFWSGENEEWVFRGDSCDRPLQSTLERLRPAEMQPPIDIRELEYHFYRDFKRTFPIHASRMPEFLTRDDTTPYWLSLMRHFGVPTRLLDFSYSLFMATFFALERQKTSDEKDEAVVWVISKTWLTKKNVKAMFKNGGETFCVEWGKRTTEAFEKIFWDKASPYSPGVFPVNAASNHQRLHLQQGLFLCPVSIERSFSENLTADQDYTGKVLKLLINRSCRAEVLLKLHRCGISRELLFPGLDGYAQGLQSRTPVLYSHLKKLEENGARVSINDRGDFLWKDYYDKYCKE